MKDTQTTKQIVIASYKSFALLIFEFSGDETITNVWGKNSHEEEMYREKYKGKKVSDIRNDKVIFVSRDYIRKAFDKKESGIIVYNTVVQDKPSKLIIRIFPAPYDEERVLTTVEYVPQGGDTELVEDKWRLALDAAGDGMWDMNLELNKIFFSPKWHEMFGYSEDEISDILEWQDKIHPDDITVAEKKLDEYLQGKRHAYSAEIRYLCKDGTYRWILSRGVIAGFSEDGKPQRFIGTHTDIHEKKLQEIRIEESEKKYKILFDYSEAMICTHDTQGIIIDINPFVTRYLGYAQEELVGRNMAELIPAPVRERFRTEYLEVILKYGSAEGMMQIQHKNGEIKILLYKNHLFQGADEHNYIIGFAQDITDRVKMEEELKNSVDTFSSAFKFSGIGMALAYPDGKWREVNDALSAMTGYSKEELRARNFTGITHPADLEKDLANLKLMLDKSIDSYSSEKRYISKSGKIIWVSVTVSPVWNKDGTPKFFIAQIVDITATKELTTQLSEKNAELENTKTSLLNKVTQLEELSYIIAHNLRGPAWNIKLLAEVLQHKQGKMETSEEAVIMSEALTSGDTVDLIGNAVTSLTSSLESLLNIAQIRLNKDIPRDDCDFKELVQHIVHQLKGDIIDKNVSIITRFDVAGISYPKPYLESILYNLISNAIKYRNPDVKPAIVVNTAMTDGRVRLSVKDNGLGIDLERHGNKIFKLNQVFHQHENSKGIGLYMTKTQIESLGGSIRVNSKPNEGAEFIVEF